MRYLCSHLVCMKELYKNAKRLILPAIVFIYVYCKIIMMAMRCYDHVR